MFNLKKKSNYLLAWVGLLQKDYVDGSKLEEKLLINWKRILNFVPSNNIFASVWKFDSIKIECRTWYRVYI